MQFLNVIVVKVKIIDGQSAVEHIARNAGDEVFSQVQLVQTFSVAEGILGNCFNIVSSYLEPCEAGEGLDGLQGEGSDLVVGEAEGVDGGGQGVRCDLSDMIVVQIEPEQPLERGEEVVGDVGDLILPQKQRGQTVAKVQVIAVRQIHNLVPGNKLSLSQV